MVCIGLRFVVFLRHEALSSHQQVAEEMRFDPGQLVVYLADLVCIQGNDGTRLAVPIATTQQAGDPGQQLSSSHGPGQPGIRHLWELPHGGNAHTMVLSSLAPTAILR